MKAPALQPHVILALLLTALMTTGALGTPSPDQHNGDTVAAAIHELPRDAIGMLDTLSQQLAGEDKDSLINAGILTDVDLTSTSPDLAAALARLTGVDQVVPPELDEDLASRLTPLIDAIAEAALRLDIAFAALTPSERTFLLEEVLRLDVSPTSQADAEAKAQALALLELVDRDALREAASIVERASVQFATSAPRTSNGAPTVAGTGDPEPIGPEVDPQHCSWAGGTSYVDATGMIEIGMTANNAYFTERVLIVDLGGDDCYENYPAAVGPGSNLGLPISTIIDLGGDDTYLTVDPHPSGPAGTTWSAGVGIGGVGLIVDRWGNDYYYAALYNLPSNCNEYGGQISWQRVYAQGVGILGAGGIIDTGGSDEYRTEDINNLFDPSCHWGKVYAYAQGVAARLGIGFLVDDTGNDLYFTYGWAEGKDDTHVHLHSQAAAAARGVAVLVDKEGHDTYWTESHTTMSPQLGYTKGLFSYVFTQASLYGTNEPREESISTPGGYCVNRICIDTIGGTTLGVNSCSSGAQDTADVGTPCDLPAVALLVDVLGEDQYNAISIADDQGFGCDWGSWAGVSAQGSAPAKGIAGLADVAADTANDFNILAEAVGTLCSTLGVRSSAMGQGGAGGFNYDYWDRPPFDPLVVTDGSFGIMLRGGACGLQAKGLTFAVELNDPCNYSYWADDVYTLRANADNAGPGLARARTFGQGGGNGVEHGPGIQYDSLGYGIHADYFGNDAYYAAADASSVGGTDEPFVAAQGAGINALGSLTNIGGRDSYAAVASNSGGIIPMPSPEAYAQADAVSNTPVTVNTCVSLFCTSNTVNFAAGLFEDVWGQDSYNMPCPANGALTGPQIWGNQPVSVLCPNWGWNSGFILGVDTA